MKTNLDIYLSAERAALGSLTLGSRHAVDQAALAAFKSDQGTAPDYDSWREVFEERRTFFGMKGKQKSPSEIDRIEAEEKAKAATPDPKAN